MIKLQVAYFLFFFLFPFIFIGRGYCNVCIPIVFTGGLLPGETSGTFEVQEEAMEFWLPILDTTVVEREVGSSIPVWEVVTT